MAPAYQDPERGGTLAGMLANRLRGEILSGAWPAGSRLPSIRKAAAKFGVSKNTVVDAYDRLVLGNLVAAKAGSGFVITFRGDAESGRSRHLAEAVDIASLLNAQLSQNFEIRVGDGRPPASWTEQSEIKRYLSGNGRILPADADAYGSALGFFPLRQQIALKQRAQQVEIKEDNLLLTFGANHALDLIIRAMLSPGDTVLVDEPGYYPLFAKLTLAQVRIVGVRRMPDGPDVDDLAAKIQSERPKLFFTQSLGHNPTGGSITLPVAHAVLKTAARSNLLIVEDDPFSDLPMTANIRLAALDQLTTSYRWNVFENSLGEPAIRLCRGPERPHRDARRTQDAHDCKQLRACRAPAPSIARGGSLRQAPEETGATDRSCFRQGSSRSVASRSPNRFRDQNGILFVSVAARGR